VIQTRYKTTRSFTYHDLKKKHSTTAHYTIAPLTGADWTRDRPVPAWVGCRADVTSHACSDWTHPGTGAVPVPAAELSELLEVRDAALTQHALRTDPNAPIFTAVASVRAAVADRRFLAFGMWPLAYLAWAACVGLALLLRFAARTLADRR
jgi:hypothetical protein